MNFFSTGIDEVDQIGQLNITGNVRPAVWNKTIVNEKGKPQRLAMDILADIVYWYRPTEVRDEASGQVIGWKKRFRADILQRSYAELVDEFGEDKKTIARTLVFLEELGVVKRVFRTIKLKSGTVLNNVMFLKLNPKRLYELTYPADLENTTKDVDNNVNEDYIIISENCSDTTEKDRDNANFTPMHKNDQRVWTDWTTEYGQNCPEGMDEFNQRVSSNISIGMDKIVQINTKNTTKITTENTIQSNLICEDTSDLHIDITDNYDFDELNNYHEIIVKNNGIPIDFAFQADKMRFAILSLCNLQGIVWNYKDRGYKNENDIVFETMVKNLLVMATSPQMTIIGGTKSVSYKHINDKLNRLLKINISLTGFLDRCIDRYLDASKKVAIKKIDQYCKAIICNTFDIYEIDQKSAFNKSYGDGVRSNWGRG